MAQENRPTPEKQLLKLIEEPKEQRTLKAAKIKHWGLSFVSLGAWMGRTSFIALKFRDLFSFGRIQSFDIKTLNKILIVGITLLVALGVANTFREMAQLRRGASIVSGVQQSEAGAFKVIPLLKVLSFYLEKARGRDIFKMVQVRSADDKDQSGPSARLMEAIKTIKLVGIAWSNDPDAMIEDTRTHTTNFLKKGAEFNGMKVVAIFRDKIVVSLEGEEIEIK